MGAERGAEDNADSIFLVDTENTPHVREPDRWDDIVHVARGSSSATSTVNQLEIVSNGYQLLLAASVPNGLEHNGNGDDRHDTSESEEDEDSGWQPLQTAEDNAASEASDVYSSRMTEVIERAASTPLHPTTSLPPLTDHSRREVDADVRRQIGGQVDATSSSPSAPVATAQAEDAGPSSSVDTWDDQDRGVSMEMTVERRAAIVGAMKNFQLDYIPPWAVTVPEDNWLDLLRKGSNEQSDGET